MNNEIDMYREYFNGVIVKILENYENVIQKKKNIFEMKYKKL